MNQKQMGAFIAQLRKEQNLTQGQLASSLGVTDKAVSKWETGRGMPDISLLVPLSKLLGVSVNELLSGARIAPAQALDSSEQSLLSLLAQNKKIKRDTNASLGMICIIFGFILQLLANVDWSSGFGQFLFGLCIGLSVGFMILGIILVVFSLARPSQRV